MNGAFVHLVTQPFQRWDQCRVSHPLTRQRCVAGGYSHDLHWTDTGPGNTMWATDTGKTFTPLGAMYVTYFARFYPQPGYACEEIIEHFPDPMILHAELARRITFGYGVSYVPGDGQRTVRWNHVAKDAHMNVWVIVSTDHRVHDPVPDPCHSAPVERWTVVGDDMDLQRSEYLGVLPHGR